jgi:hypothetical protein
MPIFIIGAITLNRFIFNLGADNFRRVSSSQSSHIGSFAVPASRHAAAFSGDFPRKPQK